MLRLTAPSSQRSSHTVSFAVTESPIGEPADLHGQRMLSLSAGLWAGRVGPDRMAHADLVALNKTEMLVWDAWGMQFGIDPGLVAEQDAVLFV